MSKGLKIFIIAIAVVLSVTAVGVGLGVGLSKNNEPETEVLTVNIDGENVKKVQLEPGDNIYTYISENYAEYTDFNTCGWFVDKSMTHSLTEGDTIAEGENVTVYTRNATLDKLTFTLNDDEATYSVSAKSEDIEGEVVIPRMYTDAESTKTGLVTKVADNGFRAYSSGNFYNITLVVMPNSIEELGEHSFRACYGLTEFYIPEKITTIGQYAFYNSRNITEVLIPDGVTTIGQYAFGNCRGLTDVAIPDSVTSLGEYAFTYCSALTDVKLPTNMEVLPDKLFYECTMLKNITFPENLTTIGERTFGNCPSINELIIPEGVTSIGNQAFYLNLSLTSVTLPSTLTTIASDAFLYDYSIFEVYNYSDLIIEAGSDDNGQVGSYAQYVYNNEDLVNGKPESKLQVIGGIQYVIDGEDFIAVSLMKRKAKDLNVVEIDERTTEIRDYAFHMSYYLEEVVIPENVKIIGESAFDNCRNLMSVTIPEGVMEIGRRAFGQCYSLTSVTIPSTCESIGIDAFRSDPIAEVYNYSAHFNIEYKSTDNGQLGNSARIIYNAEDLTGEIPESRLQIINDVVYYVYEDDFVVLTPVDHYTADIVVLDERTTEIGDHAFEQCQNIDELKIPKNVIMISANAFSSLYNVETVVIDSVYTYVNTTSDKAFCQGYGTGLVGDATTVKVLASIVDNPENTNRWLNGTAWTKSESADGDGYYTYTRVVA